MYWIAAIPGLPCGSSPAFWPDSGFFPCLTGDRYLRNRPMGRVIEPLSRMGGCIFGRAGGDKAPLAIVGKELEGIAYSSKVASAQVKSAILLAGLYAAGETEVREPHLSRDHSERMLRHFGAAVETFAGGVRVRGGRELTGREITVPGDISSAAFFLVAATIVPGSELLIRGVGVNPTRTGILDILIAMGADIELLDRREASGEPVADLLVRSAPAERDRDRRRPGAAGHRRVPRYLCGRFSGGGADGHPGRPGTAGQGNRPDRGNGRQSRQAGVEVVETEDGMEITGCERLQGCVADSRGDHRIAMSMLVAGLRASGPVTVNDVECIATSFPDFGELLEKVVAR